jgi:ATP-dependent Clp protease ATP-binding subunit ClpC
MHSSTELRQVVAEAKDISAQVSQRLTSAHLLLALFTVHNRAEILLKEKGIDEDAILALIHTVEGEPPGTVKRVQEKAREIAVGCGAVNTDCLHLLIALCGMRSTLAHDLLRRTNLNVPKLRNTALSYVTGRMPRRLTVKKKRAQEEPQSTRVQAVEIPSFPPVREEEHIQKPIEAEEYEAEEENYPAPAAPAAPQTPWDLEPTRFPLLSKLGRNITALAALDRVDPLVGRDKEVSEVIDTLLKRRSNNPLLVGEPGTGKTAIVEGLALRIVSDTPDASALKNRRIIELDVASLLAGTQLRGAFSEKLRQIRDEVKNAAGSVVIFFDEMHTLIGAGSTGEGAQDAANELKAALARGEFPCIGATTHDEYRRFIEQDTALARRFQPIQVSEASTEETLTILKGIADEYASHHGVSYDQAALEAAVYLSSRYITDRCLPDKAISLLDLAGSRARRSGKVRVDREAIARVVSSAAKIPVERLLMTDAERLLNMEQIIGLRLIGHTQVIRAISKVIRRNYAGFSHRRPIGSFLFLGPTGVGKTECARALSRFMFSNKDALVKLDMSEYIESHSVSRLIGSPPGYVGHHEGGQLTEAVRRRPYAIVLFDEVEKAHPEVQLLLLQILEEGRLTDGRGRAVDFTNVIVILTSNLGTDKLSKPGPARIGFGSGGPANAQDDQTAQEVVTAARQHFPPELWGRMDEHLFFHLLGDDDLAAIAALMIKESSDRLQAERNMTLQPDPEVTRHLVQRGCLDPKLGARPLRGAVRRMVEEPLAEAILQGHFQPNDCIRIKVEDEKIRFEKI